MLQSIKPPIKLIIADAHKVFRIGIRAVLETNSSNTRFHIEEAESTEVALRKSYELNPEVVLMEYNLPGRGGPKTTELILKRKPGIRVLALSAYDQRKAVDQMMAAGASGYALKDIDPETLVYAIKTVISGKPFYSNEIAIQLIDHPAAIHPTILKGPLTVREQEILQMITLGLKGKEIAEKLNLSKRTVDSHRERLRRKLKARNTADLIQAGAYLGIEGWIRPMAS